MADSSATAQQSGITQQNDPLSILTHLGHDGASISAILGRLGRIAETEFAIDHAPASRSQT